MDEILTTFLNENKSMCKNIRRRKKTEDIKWNWNNISQYNIDSRLEIILE